MVLSDEEKKRKAEFENREYQNLPWETPLQHWRQSDLTVLRNKKIKECIGKIK